MLYGMYKNAEQGQMILIFSMARGKDPRDFERGFIVGARTTGASVTKTAQLAGVSIVQ